MKMIEKETMFTVERFKELYSLDILDLTELKGKLTYMSWATSWRLLKEQDPNATYEIMENVNGGHEFKAGSGWIVKTKVTAFGMTLPMSLGIMDNRNDSISEIDCRDVMDSVMRCLAKNIGMFGIGLPLYIGEDLTKFKKKTQKEIILEEIKELHKEFKEKPEIMEIFKNQKVKVADQSEDDLIKLKDTIIEKCLELGYIKK